MDSKRAERLATEIPRKSFHLLASVSSIVLDKISITFMKVFGFAFLCIGFWIAILELVRLRYENVNQLFIKYCGSMMRKSEQHEMTGIPAFMCGLGLTLLLFGKKTAEYALYSLFLLRSY